MKKPKRKINMYDTQLDYIKILIDQNKNKEAINKLNYIKNKLEKHEDT